MPYGPVEEVLPYLSRRVTENQGIMNKTKKEKRLLRKEMMRRLLALNWFYTPPMGLPAAVSSPKTATSSFNDV